jgi:aspartate/methionine/tyrosine aminotransferase
MSDQVVVTSGLSKAYGIPGVRIGWIVGPPSLVETCWSQHDYLTIGPSKLSDMVARVAVQPENREALYARTRTLLSANLPIIAEWAASLDGLLEFNRPRAGAMVLVRYRSTTPSLDLCERIRVEQNTLVVPGSHVGLEGYLRIWYGGAPDYITEGLRRIGRVLSTLR